MAAVAALEVSLTVSPDLAAIVDAMAMLREALDAHGHAWTAEEEAVLLSAADVLERCMVAR